MIEKSKLPKAVEEHASIPLSNEALECRASHDLSLASFPERDMSHHFSPFSKRLPSQLLKTLSTLSLSAVVGCSSPQLRDPGFSAKDSPYPEVIFFDDLPPVHLWKVDSQGDPQAANIDDRETEWSAQLNKMKATLGENGATLAPEGSYRVFVADGAFIQQSRFSLSSWLAGVSERLVSTYPKLEIDIDCFVYAERMGMRESGNAFCRLVERSLKQKPLAEDEKVIFLGHSQGAFIFSELLKRHEEQRGLAKSLPQQSIAGFISIDPPMNVLQDYDGEYRGALDFLEFVFEVDPVFFPIALELIFPAGHDYRDGSKALQSLHSLAPKEIRNYRFDNEGEPLNIGRSENAHPDSRWAHDPFASWKVHDDDDRFFRLNLIYQYSFLLGMIPDTTGVDLSFSADKFDWDNLDQRLPGQDAVRLVGRIVSDH